MYHFYGGKQALQNIPMRGNQIYSSQLDLVTDHKKGKALCRRSKLIFLWLALLRTHIAWYHDNKT